MKTKLLTSLGLLTVATPLIAANFNSHEISNSPTSQNQSTLSDKLSSFPKNFIVTCQLKIGTGDNAAYVFGGKPVSYKDKFYNLIVLDSKGNLQTYLISKSKSQFDSINTFKKVTENSILVSTTSTFFILTSTSKTTFGAPTIVPVVNDKLPNDGIVDFAKVKPNDIASGATIVIDNDNEAYFVDYILPFTGKVPLSIDEELKFKTIVNLAGNNMLVGGENLSGLSSLYYLNYASSGPSSEVETAIGNLKSTVNQIVPASNGTQAYVATSNGVYLFNNDQGKMSLSNALGLSLMKDHPNANFTTVTLDEKNNTLYAFSDSAEKNDSGIYSINLNDNTYRKLEAKEIGSEEKVKQIFISEKGTIDIETYDKYNSANIYFNVDLSESVNPNPKPTPTPTPDANNDKLSSAAIAGIVIGSIAGVGLIAGTAYYFSRKNK